jgi:carboxypeptidase PM20D1
MKKILAVLGIAIVLLVAILLLRASTLESRQVKAEPVTDLAVDASAVAQRLAGAVRFPTVSHEQGRDVEAQAFLDLHQYLQASFPLVHQKLTREVVADYSLLYTWPGWKPELPPILLMSHMDVVPVEPGTERKWMHPPFSGAIADGYIWGPRLCSARDSSRSARCSSRSAMTRRSAACAARRPSPGCWRAAACGRR